MTTPTTAPAQPATKFECETRKFTVEEYYRMAEAGILHPDERLELICGEIVLMAPIGKPHAVGLRRVDRVLQRALEGVAIVSAQNPIHLGPYSEPEPVVAVLRLKVDEYLSEHPEPGDILLVVEIADTTLSQDKQVKTLLYAQASIPETWIMNLVDDCIETSTGPGPEGYANHTIYRRGDRIALSTLPEADFAVEDLLPPVVQKVANEAAQQQESSS